MERKKFLKGFFMGVFVTLLAAGVIGAGLYMKNDDNAVNISSVKKANTIEKLIDAYYLDEIDNDQLEAWMYKGLIAGLNDPYSTYYTEEELASLNEDTEGLYKGIGVTMQQDAKTGLITVVRCFENAPGAKAGMRPGDVLYKVNGETVSEKELSEVVKMIKSSEGEVAHLILAREGESDYLELDIPLEEVEIPMVDYEMLEDNIGYIAVYEFAEVTANQYLAAYNELEEQGMERLIIDLRGNPGGLLTSVCTMLENVLPEGLMVYTEDRDGNRKEYTCDGEHELQIPLAVLVNGNSASAAEIFSGAVQDYGVGKLVGTTTFGKGIVQQLLPLSDGSAVKLTISKYYTPNGRNIHGTGLEPDVEIELDENLKNQVTIEKKDDNQLQKAIEVVKGM